MGQNMSKSYTPPPLSLRDCIVNGTIDITLYRLCSRRQYDDEYDGQNFSTKLKRKFNKTEAKPKCVRSANRHVMQFPNNDGTLRNVTLKFPHGITHTSMILLQAKDNSKYLGDDLGYPMNNF